MKAAHAVPAALALILLAAVRPDLMANPAVWFYRGSIAFAGWCWPW